LGLPLLGQPNWEIARRFVPPVSTIQLLQTGILYGGLLFAFAITLRAARKAQRNPRHVLVEALPWLALLIILALVSGSTFLLPMEMRGSALGG
jgi:thiol:disulfide interchange protein